MSFASLFLFSVLVVFSLSSTHAAPVVNSTETSHRDDHNTINATASKSTEAPQTRITTLSPNDPLAHNITRTDQHSIETTTPVTKPPLPSTEPPPRVTTTHVIDVAKIKYEIMKRIKALSLDEIDNLLEDYDIDTLPFALGIHVGYDDERDEKHFQYLGDLGGKELKATLLYEKEKKSNMAPPPPPTAKPEPPNDSSSNELIVPNDGSVSADENISEGDANREPSYPDKYYGDSLDEKMTFGEEEGNGDNQFGFDDFIPVGYPREDDVGGYNAESFIRSEYPKYTHEFKKGNRWELRPPSAMETTGTLNIYTHPVTSGKYATIIYMYTCS